ncbi:hypothetical protein CSKR_113909 [Clonorchis sinensis]|uniref:Uncharacterized protein n=1 Tax=Clonorchis sinensis TaxID=79923 RepID=A0A3R7ES51_CLOSI|nr:hypothetical protein CSKR_113909 [Clonorchis sinensis]
MCTTLLIKLLKILRQPTTGFSFLGAHQSAPPHIMVRTILKIFGFNALPTLLIRLLKTLRQPTTDLVLLGAHWATTVPEFPSALCSACLVSINTLICKSLWFCERLPWNPAESPVCDVSGQLNVLHEATSCFTCYSRYSRYRGNGFHVTSVKSTGARWLVWLEREFTDRKVRGSNPTSASRLPLSRLGQPGSIPALVLPSGGMAVRHRKSNTAGRFYRNYLWQIQSCIPSGRKRTSEYFSFLRFFHRSNQTNRTEASFSEYRVKHYKAMQEEPACELEPLVVLLASVRGR